MTAMHDFLPNDNTYRGRKVVIFTRPDATFSLTSDGDTDGLTKADEIIFGTSLWLADTDKDGYSDGLEVHNGFSPRTNESKLRSGDLIKMRGKPEIYVLENGMARKIFSMSIFKNHGWTENTIQFISEKFFETRFKIGEVVSI